MASVADPRYVDKPVDFVWSTSTPTLDRDAISARAASVMTVERDWSPVSMSTVPTMNLISERRGPFPGPPPDPIERWTSKSVSGRIRYIVPSAAITSAAPLLPVFRKSPS